MNANNNLVVAGIDGSAITPAVCDYAAWIAKKTGGPLKLLHTIDHHPETAQRTDLTGNIGVDSRDHLLEELTAIEQQRSKLRLEQGKRLLQSAKERVLQAGVDAPIVNQRHGSLIEALIELEADIRVLVLGVRGKVHEHQSQTIGAKLEAIIRALHKPILVVNGDFKPPERLMLVYDGSPAADKAVGMVAASPLYQGLACHLVGIGKGDAPFREALNRAEARLRTTPAIALTVATLSGKPEQVLADYQSRQAIDLVVMGAFRHGRLHDLLLGSFTLNMLNQSPQPLLLLR